MDRRESVEADVKNQSVIFDLLFLELSLELENREGKRLKPSQVTNPEVSIVWAKENNDEES